MEPTPVPASSPARSADPRHRISVLEILGYCGIAAGLYGTFAVLSESSEDAESTVRITSLVLAAVFLLAGAVIGVDAPDRLARMRSACWFASVLGLTTFLALVFEPSNEGWFALVLGLSAVYALVLWAYSPRLLQQLAFFVLALTAVAVLVGFPDVVSLFSGPPDLTAFALVYSVGGASWFALGYLDLVRPARSAMVIGLVFGLEGLSLLSQSAPEVSAFLILASSAMCVFLGGVRSDRAVTGVAVLGLLIGTFGVLTVLGLEGSGPGLGAMFIGVVLLGVAVLTARSVGPGGGRPMFGRLTFPFGRVRRAEPAEPPPPPPGTTGP
ncbi:MAG: hypothetical protein ACRDG8_09890 [Actinomycetota bacterium]